MVKAGCVMWEILYSSLEFIYCVYQSKRIFNLPFPFTLISFFLSSHIFILDFSFLSENY